MPHAERWKWVFQSLQETRLAVTSGVTAYLKALGGGWKVCEEAGKGGREGRRVCSKLRPGGRGCPSVLVLEEFGGLWDSGSLA